MSFEEQRTVSQSCTELRSCHNHMILSPIQELESWNKLRISHVKYLDYWAFHLMPM